MKDAVGNDIKIGDIVKPTLWDQRRGTSLDMLNVNAEVLRFGRTRIVIQSGAHKVGDTDSVGPECVLVTQAVDGRALRTWADKHAEEKAASETAEHPYVKMAREIDEGATADEVAARYADEVRKLGL